MKANDILIYRGQEVRAGELAARKNLPLTTLASRIGRLRWSVEKAADTPPDKRFRRGGRLRKDAPRPCPELRKHSDGRAYCRWRDGKQRRVRYFGKWGSSEARAGYAVFAAEWHETGAAPLATGQVVTVNALVRRFVGWADGYYVKDGKATSEIHLYRSACKPLVTMFGTVPAADFKPSHLRAIRSRWVSEGLERRTCNGYAGRVVRVFGWGVAQELVPAAVPAALREVESLQAGRTAAPESEPVVAVEWSVVVATLPYLHEIPARAAVIRTMVELQTATGMRPGEVCRLTPEQIDRTRIPWVYTVEGGGKAVHKGKRRTVHIGPRGRAILAPLLAACPAGRAVFGWPFRGREESGRWRSVTPVWYGRFVLAAARAAGVEEWTPNQLRHLRANEIHERYESDEDVAAALGNTPEVARQVYVDTPEERVARRIAEELG